MESERKRGFYIGSYWVSNLSLVLWIFFILIVSIFVCVYMNTVQLNKIDLQLSSMTSTFDSANFR
jgi:hypothetical protein